MVQEERFNSIINWNKKKIIETEEVVKELEKRISEATTEIRLESSTMHMNDAKRMIRIYESRIEFMRIPKNNQDREYRMQILSEYPSKIRHAIPDNFPIVFHGTSNIGTVREIIKTGGLLTPKQRNESDTSYAHQIDVTYKNDISVSCDYADDKGYSFMPYGAIFAFFPEQDEIKNIVSTRRDEVVQGGVRGVNFIEQPNRLCGIITTPENIDRVKKWCEEYGWNPKKVFSHDDFIKSMEKTFNNAKHIEDDLEDVNIL